jgi:hypothetical protein
MPFSAGDDDRCVLSLDMEVTVINRKLIAAGLSVFALTPGVALACTGMGHPGAPGAIGATGATGATGSTGQRGVTNAKVRQAHLRVAHHARSRKSAHRS